MNLNILEEKLSEFPLYTYFFFDPAELEFSDRVRWICEHECTQFGKSWACPPGVGTVDACRANCLSYRNCLAIATLTEVDDITNMEQTLATRTDHEQITDQVAQILQELGDTPFVLSTESCAICPRCAILDHQPCRMPKRMHPCVESQGINIIPVLEKRGLEFQYGQNVVTWVSLLLFDKKMQDCNQ